MKNKVCILFHENKKPCKKGTYSWVSPDKVADLIPKYGKEYDPKTKKVKKAEPKAETATPKSSKDLPGVK